MPRKPKQLRCIFCKQPVKKIPGEPVLAGKYAAYRHADPPVGCKKGDPLMPDEAI